ncbi:MAG: N-acetylmuramoyl-L-alanine amidase, partial [Lentisphaeria bacterium]|nr:N-acetylmuramoyl-L-alanine amidase [Lentisphaeria bacterium]
LDARTAMCAKYKPDLFLSIHCNAVENKSVTGIETWYLGAQGGASAHGNTVKTAKDRGNDFDEYSMRAAYEFQKGMMKQFPASPDRGVKPSRFYVLRHASSPAILMEVGFISNNKEGRSLATNATQDKIVKAIIDGMIGYTGALRK